MRYTFDLKRNFYQVEITTAPPFILISVCHSLKLLQASVTEKGGVFKNCRLEHPSRLPCCCVKAN